MAVSCDSTWQWIFDANLLYLSYTISPPAVFFEHIQFDLCYVNHSDIYIFFFPLIYMYISAIFLDFSAKSPKNDIYIRPILFYIYVSKPKMYIYIAHFNAFIYVSAFLRPLKAARKALISAKAHQNLPKSAKSRRLPA